MTNLLSIGFNSDNATGTAVCVVCQSQKFRENNFLRRQRVLVITARHVNDNVTSWKVNDPLVLRSSM